MRPSGAVGAILLLGGMGPVRLSAQSPRPPRPAAAPRVAFKFPHIETRALANGMRVMVVEDHALPLVSVRAVLAVDSVDDPVGREGLYAVTLGAMREGTTSKSADQLAGDFAELGAPISPTGFTALHSTFSAALALMGDMLIHPSLDSAAVERRKALQSSLVVRVTQTPVAAPRRLFYSMLYGEDDPFVHSLGAAPASIAAITTADVRQFYATRFRPDATTLVVAGDITPADAFAAAESTFGRWATPASAAPSRPVRAARSPATTIYLRDAPGSQAYVYVGAAGPSRGGASSDAIAADAMAAVASARMQQTLRDRRSFMYSGAVGIIWNADQTSTLVGSTVVSAAKVDSALVEWLSLLRGLGGGQSQPPSARELDAARQSRTATLPARVDGPDSLAARASEIARDRLPLDYFDQYSARMSAVTQAQVTAAAAKYFDTDHLTIVVSGPRGLIEPALRAANIAPIVVIDAENRIGS